MARAARRSPAPRVPPGRPGRIEFDPARHTAAAMAGFFRIMELWGADKAQASAILGHPSDRTFYRWKAGHVAAVPHDVLRRIGYVSGIWKALQIVYASAAQADEWVRKPNRFFAGQSPIERMSAGDVTDLAAVREYLDAARAPWS